MRILKRFHRHRRRIAVVAAALPLLQTTGCPPELTSLLIQGGASFASSVTAQVIGTAAGAIAELLLTTFPSSELLRVMFGGDAGFFP